MTNGVMIVAVWQMETAAYLNTTDGTQTFYQKTYDENICKNIALYVSPEHDHVMLRLIVIFLRWRDGNN